MRANHLSIQQCPPCKVFRNHTAIQQRLNVLDVLDFVRSGLVLGQHPYRLDDRWAIAQFDMNFDPSLGGDRYNLCSSIF